ncbi:MAG: twin-arginine translocase TatA/TatE family subunit [Gemmatimonadota bacterium]|nr:twin-arginine translocase TatA/TatE family subunit [Gemmatimonadota bacterium]
MPFNLGMGELVIVLVIILLVFGAKRIPEIAGSFGKGIKEFKRNINEVGNEMRAPDRSQQLGTGAAPTPPAGEEQPEPKRLMN